MKRPKLKIARLFTARNHETGKTYTLSREVTKDKDGKPVITYKKVKPGDSNN